MAHATERLERYLADELGECRNEDVERRLDELGTLEAAVGADRVAAELDVLSALANETRYTLVRVLVAAGEELCVCELNAVVDVTESGLSHALSALVDSGLVSGRKDGRWKKYRATNRAVALVTVLDGSVSVSRESDDRGNDDGESDDGGSDE
ncbi:ArsR/SmtB family transcription factor [Halorussus amylolyticus]|uniref:ArsR/SmtB family transcription factor n=1 Tax=Halorussus amylolyticus TaxID=1126242 RepID=UPI00138EDCFC|nr:metalloregulator ArsR/SmtB family transcription factor [Halorussus amylolyticus]